MALDVLTDLKKVRNIGIMAHIDAGKTTTTGKLARVLVADGRTVLLGAADTFRAAKSSSAWL